MTSLKQLIESVVRQVLDEDFLDEGRFETAQEKNPEVAEALSQAKAEGMKSKYIDWFVVNFKKTDGFKRVFGGEFTAKNTIDYLSLFDGLAKRNAIEPKDIGRYQGVEELVDAVVDARAAEKAKQTEKMSGKDAKLIYQDAEYLVIKPESMEASCKYGYGTKWCISAKEANQFQNYTERGAKFYFFIDKKNKGQGGKDAMAVIEKGDDEGVEIYDAEDNLQDISYLTNKYSPEMHDLIYNLAFGTKAVEYKNFLLNPYEVISSLELGRQGRNSNAKTFYLEMVGDKLSAETEAQILLKLFQKIDPSNIPEIVWEYIDESYWTWFDGEDVSNELLWQMQMASQKFLGHDEENFSLLPLTLLHWYVADIEYKNAQHVMAVMREWLLLLPFFLSSEKGKLASIIGKVMRRPGGIPYVYEIAKADPKLFEEITLRCLELWPKWLNGASFNNWVGSYLSGKHNISIAITSRFVGNLQHLWEFYQETNEIKQYLPQLLNTVGEMSIGDLETVKKNADLLYQLLVASQGNKMKLLPGNFATLPEVQLRRGLALMREDMKRFFPELIH